MASETLLVEEPKTKKLNARSTTMLVHELPSSTEIYESFVWDPDDELLFESESSSEHKESEMDLSFLFEDSSISTSGEAEVPMNVGDDYVPPEDMNMNNGDSSPLSSSSFETPGWEQVAQNNQPMDCTQAALQTASPTTPHIKSDLAQSEPNVQNSFSNNVSRLPEKAKSFHIHSIATKCTKTEPKQEVNTIVKQQTNASQQETVELNENAEINTDQSNKESIQQNTATVSEIKPKTITTTDDDSKAQINHIPQKEKGNMELSQVNNDEESIQKAESNKTETETLPSNENETKIQIKINQTTESVDDNTKNHEDTKVQLGVPGYKPVAICVTKFKRKKRKNNKKGKNKRNRAEQGRKLSVKQRDRIIRKHSRAIKGTIPCPKIPDHVMLDADGSEIIMPVKLVHLFVRARSHHKLKNYKNMNYASKSYQLAPQMVVDALDNEKDVRGDFKIDDRVFAFVKKNLCTQKEYKMALRASTNELKHALLLLEFIESKLDEKLQNVKKITKFNHDACLQSIITEMNK